MWSVCMYCGLCTCMFGVVWCGVVWCDMSNSPCTVLSFLITVAKVFC